MRVGPHVAVGGTAPVGAGDSAARSRQCLEILKAALEAAGASLDDVARTRVLLTDIADWKAAIEVRKDYVRGARPVDTIMQVAGFVNPEWLVEIEVDAITAEEPSRP